MAERDVHLLLSQRAAKVLLRAIGRAHVTITEPGGDIIQAIVRDLEDQIEKPKKKGSKRGK